MIDIAVAALVRAEAFCRFIALSIVSACRTIPIRLGACQPSLRGSRA